MNPPLLSVLNLNHTPSSSSSSGSITSSSPFALKSAFLSSALLVLTQKPFPVLNARCIPPTTLDGNSNSQRKISLSGAINSSRVVQRHIIWCS